MKFDTGIKDQDREKIAQGLAKILADTYVLSAKTQGFHWNVKGSHFYPLHKMFEEQYDQLHEALDPLAERVRALGYTAPSSLQDILKLTSLKEQEKVVSAHTMLGELLEGHETLSRSIRDTLGLIDNTRDDVTADFLTERLSEHEKTAWMLRATLEE
ncbi:MAG TPA: Dps family protein [Oligoflexus sp.]|uniref:Dps family protein n=1 Tax=Oligoflexus sp. TaxID=1971216 RepID=UPI002D680CB0|nr:Dps family protein [Oligoflexus sp.]HYX39757.1 Dps family protein [Oligoflexus sp.]